VENITVPAGESLVRYMPQNPKLTFGGALSYEVPTQSGTFEFSTNWKYNTWQYFSAFNAPIDYEHPYAVGNVRVSFRTPSSRWEIAGFVNNVTNRYYRIFDFDNSSTFGSGESVYSPPRWYGGEVTYRF
jgi:iron complex outermembrane receptor protein